MSTINNKKPFVRNLTDRLDSYLAVHGHITPAEYRTIFGGERLAPRILELRKRGRNIRTTSLYDFSGQRYHRYELVRAPQATCAA